MGVILITAEERSVFSANAPAASEIATAFRSVAVAPGGWLGPAPRITREAVPGERFVTRAAWLYAVPLDTTVTTPLAAGLTGVLRERLDAALDAVGAWQPSEAVVWSEALHGSLAWWRSGEAARTRTRDAFPILGGRLDADENATGPTTRATHPSTTAEHAGDAAHTAGEELERVGAFPWLAVSAVAVAVAVVAWQAGPYARLANAALGAKRRKGGR